MRTIILALCALITNYVIAQTDTLNIYINTGQVRTIDSNLIAAKAFNKSSDFNFDAQVFRFNKGTSVYLQIHNEDTVNHVVDIESFVSQVSVKKNDVVGITLPFNNVGAFRIFESSENADQRYLGLSGLFVVEEKFRGHFFWNLKEFQSNMNQVIAEGGSMDLTNYRPNYFLINGLSNPKIDQDTLAKVRGNVGDTLQLFVLNSGNAVHSLHFHGYHVKVIYSSRSSEVVGWVKDTYALYKGEVVQLEIVPDKPGEYPVHDHNLVAITANNIYPKGMFTTLVIKP